MYFAKDGTKVYGFYGWTEFENLTGPARNATCSKNLKEAIRRRFPRAEIANTKAAIGNGWINEKRYLNKPFEAGNRWCKGAHFEMPLM